MEHTSDRDEHQSDNDPSTVEFFPDMKQFLEPKGNDDEISVVELPEWAAVKIGTLQSRLESIQNVKDSKKYVGSGPQRGAFSSHTLYGLANEIFGFNGWSSEVLDCYLIEEIMDEEKDEFSARYGALVRVSLKDAIYNDARGIGDASKLPFKHMCLNKAKKEAVTDATKKAIIGLSNVLMNYELQEVQKTLKSENT